MSEQGRINQEALDELVKRFPKPHPTYDHDSEGELEKNIKMDEKMKRMDDWRDEMDRKHEHRLLGELKLAIYERR